MKQFLLFSLFFIAFKLNCSPLAVAHGGTGLSSISMTNNTWSIFGGTTATDPIQIPLVSRPAGRTLINNGAGPLSWIGAGISSGGLGLSTIAVGALPIPTGGEGCVTLSPSATLGVPLVTQGSNTNPAYTTCVVGGGGTGLTTMTAYAVLCAGTTSTGAFQSLSSTGLSGQPLISAGAGALPAFGTITVPGGGTGLSSLTQYNLLVGNGTSTPNFIAPSATSGIPLVSQGAAANPAYSTAVVAGGGSSNALTASIPFNPAPMTTAVLDCVV
jgi:hypothetical protein